MKRWNKSWMLVLIVAVSACSAPSDISSGDAELDRKVADLMSKMTIEEKIGQLTLFTSDMDQTGAFLRPEYIDDIRSGQVGAIFNAYGAEYTRKLQEMAVNETRLGIPLLFGYDVVHGHRTIFPVPLAEAASWDLNAIELGARVSAREAASEGLHWTFAPMVDISRDPRWGRIVEGAGEDPFLGSRIAEARVRGFQGDDLMDVTTLAATAKHFVAYGAAQAGRDYHSVDMSERELREVYLPPFKAALDAGAVSVMTAFNDLNGLPATANEYLFTDILRDEWGFNGFVVTDYTAIMELLYHGVAEDEAHASELSLKAGIDMSMQDGYFQMTLANLLEEGRISMSDIDKAVARVLRVKFQLGLFDDPFRYSDIEREQAEIMKPENIEAARDMARKSVVLLKNENNVLPLNDNVRTIAVVGPMGDNKRDMIGSWSAAGDWSKSVTLVEGLRLRYPNARVLFAEGTGIEGSNRDGFAAAVSVARQADIVLLALGEAYWMSGEAASRADIGLPGNQVDLAMEITRLGKPTAAVIMSGRPLTINWLHDNVDAVVQAWFLGTTAGNALADVLSGDYNPSGKLPVTFPYHVGQIPIYHSMLPTGRPFIADNKYTTKYLDIPNEPLYVFGHGLSYTTFDYSNISLSGASMAPSGSITASITVTNSGDRAGEEVVQLYVFDHVGSLSRPVRELKGFEKIALEPGESRQVHFTINDETLSFIRKDGSWGPESGRFTVYIGGSSAASKEVHFIRE
jgi:beta-glucosidase